VKSIKIASDIIPLGEFKTGISACMKKVQATGHSLIITRNGRPAGVLLSPVEYDNWFTVNKLSNRLSKAWPQQNPGMYTAVRRSGRYVLKKEVPKNSESRLDNRSSQKAG
jgi:prevent-host-death family protein